MRHFVYRILEIGFIALAGFSGLVVFVGLGITFDEWPVEAGVNIGITLFFGLLGSGAGIAALNFHRKAVQARQDRVLGHSGVAPAPIGFAPGTGGLREVSVTLVQPQPLDCRKIPELSLIGQPGYEQIDVRAQVVRMPASVGAIPAIAISRNGEVLAELERNSPNYPALFGYVGATLTLRFFVTGGIGEGGGTAFDYRISALV